jgi:hypothetical protein
MSVYLDYNASTPIDLRVLDCMVDVYKNSIGNADSRTHSFGERARSVVEHARKQASTLLGISSDEVFFTSGATESNNIAIRGLVDYGKKNGKMHIITTAIEHKAVLETAKYLSEIGFEVEFIKPEINGRVNASDVLDKVREDTLLVSVMHVNNETGIIQPVKEIGDSLNQKDVLFHVDATQSCGKLVEEIRGIKYNMLSFSAHKLMGPQGVGVLVLMKNRYKLPPVKNIMYGGQQEHGIRPGTIPVALVAGCGMTCEISNIEYKENAKKAIEVKKAVLQEFDASGMEYSINGDQKFCIDTTINVSLKGVSSEALMISTKQFCGVSNGSACTSKSYSPSYVLAAMGIDDDTIENSLRISWGAGTNKNEAVEGIRELLAVAKQFSL